MYIFLHFHTRTHLPCPGTLPASHARFYGAAVILALEHIHSKCIVYRNLRPENILLDGNGYIQLIDFSLSKDLTGVGRTVTLCGAADYLAPEIIGE